MNFRKFPPVRWALLLLGWAWIAPDATRAGELTLNAQLIGRDDAAPFSYMAIQVRNNSPRPLRYDLRVRDLPNKGLYEYADQAIEAMGRRTYHLATPLKYSIWIEAVDDEGDKATTGVNYSDAKSYLNISELQDQPSQATMLEFTSVTLSRAEQASAPADVYPFGSPMPAIPAGMGGSMAVPAPGVEPIIANLTPDALPDNWLCYSPFRMVHVRDSAWRRLGEGERNALLGWVDAGGTLVVYGAERDETQKYLLGTVRFHRGTLVDGARLGEPSLSTTREYHLVNRAVGQLESGAPFPFAQVLKQRQYGGLLLASLFFVIAGPLNHFYFWRRRRIRMLLATVPLISMAFCALMVVHFVFSEGFSRKGGTIAWTILDEASDRALTASRHEVYSGLYPFGGFRFDSQAALLISSMEGRGRNYQFELGNQQWLRSGLFVPRVGFPYMTIMPHRTRERLLIDRDRFTVTNGFEHPLIVAVVRIGGRTYAATGLAAGAQGKLTPAREGGFAAVIASYDGAAAPQEYMRDGANRLFSLPDEAIRYAVLFDRPGDVMQPGLKLDGQARHALFSIDHSGMEL